MRKSFYLNVCGGVLMGVLMGSAHIHHGVKGGGLGYIRVH